MIDHVGLKVASYARSRAFYEAALEPLGYELLMEPVEGVGGFGTRVPDLWIIEGEASLSRTHVAFASPDRPTVDFFYAAALAAGGRDNGPPGLCPDYHSDYYAAFVLDPDGNNVEAVCHKPA